MHVGGLPRCEMPYPESACAQCSPRLLLKGSCETSQAEGGYSAKGFHAPARQDRSCAAFALFRVLHKNLDGQVTDFTQCEHVDLRVHLRGCQGDVPEMVGDLLQRNTFCQQMG